MLSNLLSRRVLPAACLLVLAACGGGPEGVPVLGMNSSPRTLPTAGGTANILLDAKDGKGAAGTGVVTLTAAVGSFEGGGNTVTVTLSAGKGTVGYTCLRSADADCVGTLRIEGSWNGVSSSVSIVVSGTSTPTDSGTPTTDSGTPDAGTGDAGANDGGSTGSMDASVRIVIALEKSSLVGGTGDNMDITATATTVATGLPIAAGTPMVFTTDVGSFVATPGTKTTTVSSNASGAAVATLHVAGAPSGPVALRVTALDGWSTATPQIVGVASIVFRNDASIRPVLGIQASGRETTTPIYFEVKNSTQQPVPGVEVTFTVSGVGGASVTPKGVTNSTGIATTTLQSGDEVGIATVRAVISATQGANPEISATHPGTPVSGGKPSDQGLTVTCSRKNLGAFHSEPPRSVKMICTASLSDRFTNPVGVPTVVNWYTEAGKITSATTTAAATTTTGGGTVTTDYDTTLPKPYDQTTPLAGEPFIGTENPRDALSTIIAVVSGEEEFYDGSGSSNGVKNGKWDPGEWFVDLPEPFIDWNDNGVRDGAEPFIDTERINCANPTAPPTKDTQWNGPNGCWDSNTQIWTSIHVLWTGPLVLSNFYPTPTLPGGGYSVPPSPGAYTFLFNWADKYLNRMSNDGAGFQVMVNPTTRGSASVLSPNVVADDYSFSISYRKVEATESGPDGGVFTVNGPCDTAKPAPPGSTTSPVKTRCIRDYVFSNWGYGNNGTVTVVGGSAQTPLADGGIPPPTDSTLILSTTHQFSTPSSQLLPLKLQ